MTKEEFSNYIKKRLNDKNINDVARKGDTITVHTGQLSKDWVDYLRAQGIEAKLSPTDYWDFRKITKTKMRQYKRARRIRRQEIRFRIIKTITWLAIFFLAYEGVLRLLHK